MIEPEKEEAIFECSACRSEIHEGDEFCTECGALFKEGIKCSVHSEKEAEGICIICCYPFCNQCGGRNNNRFLCNSHYDYEIYQGMARVYGDLDDTNVQYVKSCLEQEGIHPFIFCKVQPKGGSRLVYFLYGTDGDTNHIVNEIKIMVPCQEVVAAEEILKELKVIK